MVLLFFIEYFEMKKKVFFDVQSHYRLLLWIKRSILLLSVKLNIYLFSRIWYKYVSYYADILYSLFFL